MIWRHKFNNDVVRIVTGIMEDRVNLRVQSWFEHMARMYDVRLVRRARRVEVIGSVPREGPRLWGWMV